MERKTLVTGGLGFLGGHLVRALRRRGDQVRILDLESPGKPLEGVEYHKGSITEPGDVRRAMEGVDTVFHMAAKAGLWTRRNRDFYFINQTGSRTVYQTAESLGVSRIIHTSTESILKSRNGRPRNGELTDESVRWSLEDMPGPYCRSKFLAEQEAMDAARRGVPVVVVNPSIPIGPGDWRLTPPTRMLLGYLNGRNRAVLDTTLNLVDARDIARGHLLAEERGRVGERYILGNENIRISGVLQILEELTGIPMPRKQVPYWLALGFGYINEGISNYLTGRPPVAPLTGVRLARTPLRLDNRKAREELGLEFRSIRESLADEVRWFQDRGLLKISQRRAG